MSFLAKINTKKASSRRQIGIKEVRDDILILPDNSHCLILETSSVNFELKSDAEQDTLIDSFQTFLNALPCTLQVLIRVRELDVSEYLDQIARNAHDEKEAVYKKQLKNYQEFIKSLILGNKILSRRFYIVLCEKPREKEDFFLIREKLMVNQDIVIKGLEKMGMKAKSLSGLAILNLFYSFYDSKQAKLQPLTAKLFLQLEQYGKLI